VHKVEGEMGRIGASGVTSCGVNNRIELEV
jgi:hypothetical protein